MSLSIHIHIYVLIPVYIYIYICICTRSSIDDTQGFINSSFMCCLRRRENMVGVNMVLAESLN